MDVRPGDARGVGRHDDGPVHLGQLGQSLRRELGVEEESAGADGQDVGVVADDDQCTPVGQQHPLESVAQWLPGSNQGESTGEGRSWFAPREAWYPWADMSGPVAMRGRCHAGTRTTRGVATRSPARAAMTASRTDATRTSSMPPGPSGHEAGTRARRKPMRAASDSRRGAWGT